MFFSILIPVYNTSRYLKSCMDSVLIQTEKDYEVILIDDGSTDESGMLCDQYADAYPWIRVIHKENEGLLMTRRRGFAEAQGDYFICIDSDDQLYDSQALEMIRKMIEEKHCDLVQYNYVSGKEIDSDSLRVISTWDRDDGFICTNLEDKQDAYYRLLYGKFFNSIWSKAISRSLIDIDIDYSLWDKTLYRSQGEDALQNLHILDQAKCIGYIDAPLYFYRSNPDSISNNVDWNYYAAYRTLYLRQNHYIKKWQIDGEHRALIRTHRINMIMSLLINGYHSEQREEWLAYLKEVSEDPFYKKLLRKKDKTVLFNRIVYYQILRQDTKAMLVTIKTFKSISACKKTIIGRLKRR